MVSTTYQQLINCVRVSNSIVCSHIVIVRATSKPTNGTCKSDMMIWWYGSIWNVSCSTFLTRSLYDVQTQLLGKTQESSVLHSILCPLGVHFSEFVVNVFNWSLVALSKRPSRGQSLTSYSCSFQQWTASKQNINNDHSHICCNICNWYWILLYVKWIGHSSLSPPGGDHH